jgi:iron complex outermembrane receptor protein
LGIQQESYVKEVTSATLPEERLTDHPLRAYGTAALALTDRLTGYAGYTQGLEDSGVAPSSAENRGTILPDARTWQTDAGLRYSVTPRVKLIMGVFEIEKPYFNFDSRNVDRELGLQRATGLEMSVSGEVLKNLDLAAGMLLGEVKIIGPNLSAGGVGSIAFGQPRVQATINADYKFPRWPAVSADLTIYHFGAAPASVDDATVDPALTALNLGARYRFTLLGAPATLRVQVQNLTNAYYWNMALSPGFAQFAPRTLFGYLTADF